MSNKQSSIDWLEQEFVKLERTIGVYGVFYELLGKAKEMHKQEIGIAYQEGLIDGMQHTPKDYYNETFGE